MHKCTYSTPRSWAYKFMPTTRHLIKTSCICGRATASGPYTEEYLKKKVWNVDVVGLFSLVWCPNWYITFRLPTLEKFSPSFIRIHHQLFFISSIYIHPSLSIDTCVHHPLSVVFVGSLVALLHHPFCSLFNYILFHYQPACIGTTTFTHLYYKHWRGLGIFRLEFQIVVF